MYRTTGPTVDKMGTIAAIILQLLGTESSFIWGSVTDKLVESSDFLVIGRFLFNILPGNRCDVGHGVDIRDTWLPVVLCD